MTAHHRRVSGAITVVALAFLVLPLAMVVLFSFHSSAGLSFPFKGFSTRWYEKIFNDDAFLQSARNSLVVATAVAVATLVAGTAAAYGLSKSPARYRSFLSVLFFLPITLPGLFIGVGLLTLFVRVHVTPSLLTVGLGHFLYVLPYFLLIAVAALNRTEIAMEEAAADLGATPRQVFFKVTLPQLWPLLAGAACLAFALSFDEFIITFFVIGDNPTLPLYIWSALRRTVDPSINAVSTLLLVGSLVLFVIAFLFTVRGQKRTATADKPEGLPMAVEA